MKTKIIVFAVVLSIITTAFISTNLFQTTSGPHGGRLQQVENFNIEIKTSSPEFYAYLLNKQFNPIGNKGVSCEIRFYFPDSTDLDVTLKPYQNDGFRMESSLSGYQSYRVLFNAFGKTISAKFENENAIVLKK
jgi:hypothetical protein